MRHRPLPPVRQPATPPGHGTDIGNRRRAAAFRTMNLQGKPPLAVLVLEIDGRPLRGCPPIAPFGQSHHNWLECQSLWGRSIERCTIVDSCCSLHEAGLYECVKALRKNIGRNTETALEF